MLKQILSFSFLLALVMASGFRAKSDELWNATLLLEGQGKNYVLVSDAVYGGYNSHEKKFFLFGKNHMFQCKEDVFITKAFQDMCTLNGSGQFEFQLNNINSIEPSSKTLTSTGKLNLLKNGGMVSGTFKNEKGKGKEISFKGNFSQFGFSIDPETAKKLTGKFTLTFASKQ
jgi:hypothetical protein